ncbi:MAG TPA: DUF4124 domain-containing protein [Rudaea sp.]|jgi:hypothetical protein
MPHTDHDSSAWQPTSRATRWYEWLLILLLLGLAGGVRATTVYKCTDAQGAIAYQQLPCVGTAHESTIEIAAAPAYAKSPEYALEHAAPAAHVKVLHASRRESEPMSYECRTADGQVFYRHNACPHSVPATTSSTRGAKGRSGRGSAASAAVSSSRVPRDEACRRIHGAGSIGRSGHQHDEDVSTYDRNLGRDPCR